MNGQSVHGVLSSSLLVHFLNPSNLVKVISDWNVADANILCIFILFEPFMEMHEFWAYSHCFSVQNPLRSFCHHVGHKLTSCQARYHWGSQQLSVVHSGTEHLTMTISHSKLIHGPSLKRDLDTETDTSEKMLYGG